MAHVRRAPNGKGWECRWSFNDSDPDRPGKTKRKFQKQRFRTKAGADAKAREIEDRRASGLSVDHRAGKESVEVWADRWHSAYVPTVKPHTARTAMITLDATVIPLLGHMRICDVTPATVVEFLRQVQARPGHKGQPLSPATTKLHYLVLNNVLQYAAQNRAIAFNPAQGVRLPTVRSTGRLPREPLFLTPKQIADLADAFDKPYGLLVRFLAFTGLRVGECAGLNIGDVDTRNRIVYVRRTRSKVTGGWEAHTPKSGKVRTTPLPRALAAALAAYIENHPNADDEDAPLWPGRKLTGHSRYGNTSDLDYDQPWNPAVFYRTVFKPTVKTTEGIPDTLHQHDLRHSFASICASNGIPAAQVAEWMGHGNEIVTRTIYTHLFAEDTTAHEAALDAAFDSGVVGAKVVALRKRA